MFEEIQLKKEKKKKDFLDILDLVIFCVTLKYIHNTEYTSSAISE